MSSTTTTPAAVRRPTLPPGRGPRRWGHPALGAVVAAAIGMPAAAGGAGVGIRHVQKTGMTVESVTGLAVLIIGLSLLAFAGMVLWRAAGGWRRLWLLPAAVLGLLATWSMTLAVMFTNVPRTALGPLTPASRGLTYRACPTPPARRGPGGTRASVARAMWHLLCPATDALLIRPPRVPCHRGRQ
jgi:hypothetical protein